MLTLINGDGNPRVTAAQDADWYGSLTGEKTCIMPANDKFSATVADANTIEISSGVLITKEGRRVQIDAETIEEIIIPTGTQGTDTYYIIGFHLYIDESGQQVAETFVETMENESDTITETTFREGSTSIYISLYRVKRSGLTLESVTRICPMYELSADEIVYGNTNVGAELTQINEGLSEINTNLSDITANRFIYNGNAYQYPLCMRIVSMSIGHHEYKSQSFTPFPHGVLIAFEVSPFDGGYGGVVSSRCTSLTNGSLTVWMSSSVSASSNIAYLVFGY